MADTKLLRDRIESIKFALDEMALIKEINEAEQKLKDIDAKIKLTKKDLENYEEDSELHPKPLKNYLYGLKNDLLVYERKYEKEALKWEYERKKW